MPAISSKNRQEGPVAALVKNLGTDAKSALKALHFAALGKVSFSQDGYDVTVNSIQANGRLLEVNVSVSKGGVPIEVSNPLQYLNPPIMVPDGTFYQETDAKGVMRTLPNYKEDIVAAGKQIIVDTLKALGV